LPATAYQTLDAAPTPKARAGYSIERSVRLTAGLIMFSYAICHLTSHAMGLFLLPGIEGIGHRFILAPWRTPVGLTILLASFTVHLCLGLWALFRRRHLRMPAIEAWQLGLGLTIPLLLAPHVTDARLAVLFFGLEDSYFRILYHFWISDPAFGLPRQFFLLVFIWTHGCIGIHMWLRYRPWYRKRAWMFLIAAVTLPILAILGIVNAGWHTILNAATDPNFAAAHGPPGPASPKAGVPKALGEIFVNLQLGYLALLAGVLVLRLLRNLYERLRERVCVEYRNGVRAFVPRGYSILEASRWAKVPHASVCGGRGRCSTCRVRVLLGLESLAEPSSAELETLRRVNAPDGVRLACQARLRSDISVTPLLPVDRPCDGLRVEFDEGREIVVTALFVDLRDSTRLAADRLPFDAIFIVDRYVQTATNAICAHGGYVTSVAGDGIMSVFGLDGNALKGAGGALLAMRAIWRGIDHVNQELVTVLHEPLRFGMGAHTGLSVIGAVGPADRPSLQFLGDTGNVAAKLECLTKEFGCVGVVSTATLAAAKWPNKNLASAEARIVGWERALPVRLIVRPEDLAPRPIESAESR